MKLLTITSLLISSIAFSQSEKPLYLDANQPVELRLNDLMSRMTLEEKVYQMNQFVDQQDQFLRNIYQ